MLAEDLHYDLRSSELQCAEPAPAGDLEELKAPYRHSLNWRVLLSNAGFALEDEEGTPDVLTPVQRVVDAAKVPLLLDAWRVPASVFELALKPVAMHQFVSTAPPVTNTSTACRIVRLEGVTRCTTVPITDTAEWQEKEFHRRAKQRPPRPNKQRFQLKGSSKWAAAAN